ncbi:amphi-Trp domain-containing protein [Halococcus sediminicola]|uniref:amphi-Trp domain-containing protein n=1 Tax=Halococcus sediminicola TaxID=1264579 RepID=UPI00067893A5
MLLLGAVVNAVIAGRAGDAAGNVDAAVETDTDAPDDGRRVHAHEQLSRAELALFFDELRTAFDGDGDATVRAGSDAVTVHPTEPLDCEIEVRETADGERVVVRTQWDAPGG